MTQSTFINLHSNEYSQELSYYPFLVNLDRFVASYNTFDDLSNRVCVGNETEDLNLHVFNMIAGTNASRTLKIIYHANVNVSLMVENITWIISGITISVGVTVKVQKNIMCAKKAILKSCNM